MYFKSEEYVRKSLNMSEKKLPYWATEVLRKLKSIPEQDFYNIVGYGSLMNQLDIPRTMPTGKNFRSGVMKGYQRVFNCGMRGIQYMNIEKSENPKQEMTVGVVTIKKEDLVHYVMREGLYEVIEVEYYDDFSQELAKGLTVICTNFDYLDKPGSPMLNYIHLCLSGIMDLNNMQGVMELLDETTVYKRGRRVSLRDYIDNLDLLNYMIMNEYKSR